MLFREVMTIIRSALSSGAKVARVIKTALPSLLKIAQLIVVRDCKKKRPALRDDVMTAWRREARAW